jgi:hypothetical protein
VCVWQASPRRRGGLWCSPCMSPHALPSPGQTLPCPALINPYDWSTAPHHVAYVYDIHTGCGLQRMGGSKGNSSTSPPRCCAIDIQGHTAEGTPVSPLLPMRSGSPAVRGGGYLLTRASCVLICGAYTQRRLRPAAHGGSPAAVRPRHLRVAVLQSMLAQQRGLHSLACCRLCSCALNVPARPPVT